MALFALAISRIPKTVAATSARTYTEQVREIARTVFEHGGRMYKIVTDSVASLGAADRESYDIDVISLYVNRDGVEYKDAEMDLDDFYKDIYEMIDDIPTSSQPSRMDFENYFEKCAKEGDDVLGVWISSLMSGTFDGALAAARAVQARHASWRFKMVDATSNSYDEGFCAIAASEARAEGKSLDEAAQVAAEAAYHTRYVFAPESLRFLKAGGRIGGAAALLGGLIKLCPILTVQDGEADTFAKVRTAKKAQERMVEQLKHDIKQAGFKDMVVHYIGSRKPADEWAKQVIEPIVGRTVKVLPVSPVIGLHVGPAVGIAYRCVERIAETKLTKLTPTIMP